MKSKPQQHLDRANGAAGPTAAGPKHAGAVDTKIIANVCVYCGSGEGRNPAYAAAARQLGAALAVSGIGLVYGGGSLGLMGEVARATLQHGGRVTGIIPQFLSSREKMLTDVTELVVTDDMHQRKMMMFKRSDAFVALPGGVGTLEELVEQLTWSQLERHRKPIVLVNIEGFWTPFLALLQHMRDETFIRSGLEVTYKVVDDARDVLPTIIAAAEPTVDDVASQVEQHF